MKSKFLIILFSALTIVSVSLNAQDRNMTETEMKSQQDEYQSRYNQQKKTLQNAYNSDKKAITEQNILTPIERKAKRDAIKDRYLEQKQANKDTYKAEKDRLKDLKKAQNDEKIKIDGEDMKQKNNKGNKMKAKPNKPAKQ